MNLTADEWLMHQARRYSQASSFDDMRNLLRQDKIKSADDKDPAIVLASVLGILQNAVQHITRSLEEPTDDQHAAAVLAAGQQGYEQGYAAGQASRA
jgi:hypothetical protein